MNTQGITIGADPELFIVDESGRSVPSTGLIGGTKSNPRVVCGGSVQEDNVLAEINIDPANTQDEFVVNINRVMHHLESLLPEFKLVPVPSMTFNLETLIEAGDSAFEFGCDPDFNAYTYETNDKPDPYSNIRTGGGHIHIGLPDINESNVIGAVRSMDLYTAIPSLLFDGDTRRRSMYGMAGCFRMKEYGFEYRTLSNFWLSSDTFKRWVYDNTILAMENMESSVEIIDRIGVDEIQRVINDGDHNTARHIVHEYNIPIPLVHQL